jgi:hypothetical protein
VWLCGCLCAQAGRACTARRWKEGDLSEWSAISYPDALPAYAEAEFEKMKQVQADLLGIKNGPRAKL